MIHASTFDRFRAGDSPLHRLDPRVKVLLAVAFILSTMLLPDGAWPAFALSEALLLFAAALSGLGAAYTLKRSLIALPFALAAVTTAFTLPGKALLSLPLGSHTLTVTDAGGEGSG